MQSLRKGLVLVSMPTYCVRSASVIQDIHTLSAFLFSYYVTPSYHRKQLSCAFADQIKSAST